MVTVLIAMSAVTSSAASAANSNLSRTKRQLTYENGLRVTDLWLKLLFDWFPNLFPGQLMSTPLLFLPQVSPFLPLSQILCEISRSKISLSIMGISTLAKIKQIYKYQNQSLQNPN